MDNKDILAQKKTILEKLSKRQLKDAFDLLMKLIVSTQDWQVSGKLSELETNYKYMLHYQFEGVVDDERDVIYNKTLRQLYELVDDVTDELLMVNSPNMFYEKLRVNAIHTPIGIDEYKKDLQNTQESLLLVDLLEAGDRKRSEQRTLLVKRERIGTDLFNTVFTSPRSTDEFIESSKSFLCNEVIATREKCLFVSALTLNLLHRFDAQKISLLLEACCVDEPAVKQRAIVGLIIILQIYDARWKLYPECQFQLDSLSENESFRKSVSSVVKQLIRSRETEAISKKLTEEIIPEMMKFNSLAGKKLNMEDLMGETDFTDKNPDWKKELENSGLANKLQEYSSLQMEGADVFHSTFSGLKSFSFFRELNNWFLPFDLSYSELQPLTIEGEGINGLLRTAVLGSNQMCNSDKYSFSLSLLQIPESQRQMMLGRFGEEAEQLKELQKDTEAINPKITDEIISNLYIQDLYRFFKLYPYKNNFRDIFNLRLNFYEKESISPLISDKENMLQIANFCFEKNFFDEAQSIYTKILDLDATNSDLWQRLGYCKQMLNDLQGALECYLQAELLSFDNSWVIKRIAQVYKSLKDPQHALEYYQRALYLKPNNLSLELNIGHCYLELGDYEKALNSYFKVELLDSNSTKAWRPIAWTAFLVRKFDLAKQYYEQILSDKPTVHDYMNLAHVELCLDNKKRALELYLSAANKADNFDKFIQLFDDDKKELIAAGINSEFLLLLIDALKYKFD